MIIFAFRRQAVMTVAFDLVAKRANLLAMAQIATFAHIDVAPFQLERGVGAHAVDMLDRAPDPKERRDLHRPADRHHDQYPDQQQDGVAFQPTMVHRAGSAIIALGRETAGTPLRTVFHRLKAMISVPARYRAPPMARMM